jgi:hypothetical protein
MVRGLEDEKLDGWLAEASEAAVIKSSPVRERPLGGDEQGLRRTGAPTPSRSSSVSSSYYNVRATAGRPSTC